MNKLVTLEEAAKTLTTVLLDKRKAYLRSTIVRYSGNRYAIRWVMQAFDSMMMGKINYKVNPTSSTDVLNDTKVSK